MELHDGSQALAGIRTEETRRLLKLLRERLDEAGGAAIKLEPREVEGLCSRAAIEGDAADAFRVLVRGNLVRLRGRWREGRSAVRAPVYVERLTEGGLRALAALPSRSEERVGR